MPQFGVLEDPRASLTGLVCQPNDVDGNSRLHAPHDELGAVRGNKQALFSFDAASAISRAISKQRPMEEILWLAPSSRGAKEPHRIIVE